MRALLTGGTGFVGGALLGLLLEERVDVVAIGRSDEALAALAARGARAFRADLGDPSSIAAAATGCDVLIHAAGSSALDANHRALGWANVAATDNALRAARHAGVRRFVHISCADVTLTGGPRPRWNEDNAPTTQPYGAHARTKLEAEELVIGSGSPALETVVLRPAYLWGAGDTTNLPGLCREGLSGGIRLSGSGNNLMSTTHVDNLASATLRAAQVPEAAGAIYLIVDGEIALQREFFASISEAVGLPAPRRGLPYSLGLPIALVGRIAGSPESAVVERMRRGSSSSFDGQRARREIGYTSPISRAQGLESLAAWARAEGGPAAIAQRPARSLPVFR